MYTYIVDTIETMYRRMDVWMDGWMHACMHGWMDGCIAVD